MKPIVAALLAALPCLALSAMARDAQSAELTFSLYALGIPVAESVMSVDLAQPRYRMAIHYGTSGLARLFSGDRLDEQSTGVFTRGVPYPAEFKSFVRLHGQDRTVTLDYRDGTPLVAAINPPNAGEREEVPDAQRAHVIDPMSALAAMMELAARTGRCDLNDRTYDGRRLEYFESHTAGEEDIPANSLSRYAGRALRCDYSSQTLAGFRQGDGREEDARARKGTLWLAHAIPSGPLVPVHGQIDTRFLGQATMYLTGVSP